MITFATACKGRLMHLRETLMHNMAGNPGAKFLVLDYDSRDGLEQWVRTTLSNLIDLGKVKFCKVMEKQDHFKMSHARNVEFLMSDTDFTVNCDADCFLRPGIVDDIEVKVSSHRKKVVTHRSFLEGFLGTYRETFLQVKGYDEAFENWGYEDYDMYSRLRMAGCEKVSFDKGKDTWNIKHGNDLRVQNMVEKDIGRGQAENLDRRRENAALCRMAPNSGKRWGVASVQVNFERIVNIGEE